MARHKKKIWISPEIKVIVRSEGQELVLSKCTCTGGAPPSPACAIYTCHWNSSPSGS